MQYNYVLKIMANDKMSEEQQFDIADMIMDRLSWNDCASVEFEYLGEKVGDND